MLDRRGCTINHGTVQACRNTEIQDEILGSPCVEYGRIGAWWQGSNIAKSNRGGALLSSLSPRKFDIQHNIYRSTYVCDGRVGRPICRCYIANLNSRGANLAPNTLRTLRTRGTFNAFYIRIIIVKPFWHLWSFLLSPQKNCEESWKTVGQSVYYHHV